MGIFRKTVTTVIVTTVIPRPRNLSRIITNSQARERNEFLPSPCLLSFYFQIILSFSCESEK